MKATLFLLQLYTLLSFDMIVFAFKCFVLLFVTRLDYKKTISEVTRCSEFNLCSFCHSFSQSAMLLEMILYCEGVWEIECDYPE